MTSSRVPLLVLAVLAAALGTIPLTGIATAALSASASGRIAVGDSHTCVVTNAGGVKCWGANTFGQLGNGSGSAASAMPVNVTGLTSGAVAVAAGARHTCALTSDGGVECWGQGVNGELGNGSRNSSPTPVDVQGLSSGVAAIAADGFHTCALTTAGGVKCWGDNAFDVLGDGSAATRRVSPVDVVGLSTGVVAIATAESATCALTSAGRVKCWGAAGFLGNGIGSAGSPTPVDVAGVASGVTAIGAGGFHTCAVMTGGGVKCWGDNQFGELGNGATNNILVLTPVDVVGLTGAVTAVAPGGDHTCALRTDGGVSCWGRNGAGQLGDGTINQSTMPIPVPGVPSGAIAVATGGSVGHTCALLATGAVRCWGYNADGELGNGVFGVGAKTSLSIPVNVVGLGPPQTIVLRASRAPGTISRGTAVTFTATVRPLEPVGSRTAVRFEVYRKVSGAWKLVSGKAVAATASGLATLRWTFSSTGAWYVRAEALPDLTYAASPWSARFSYTVR